MTTFALAILVRNQASGLIRTLQALNRNEFDEILILDDASSEDITQIVLEVCQDLNLEGVKVFTSQKNIGTFENLKRGFQLANSDFVTTMAAEDFLVPGFVSKLRTYVQSKDKKVVYVPFIQGVSIEGRLDIGKPQFSQNPLRDFLRLRNGNLSHGGGATYPRLKVLESSISQVSTFNLVEDWLMFYLLSESGFRFRTIEEVLYIHQVDVSQSAKLVRSNRHKRYEMEIRRLILNRRLGIKLRMLVSLQRFFQLGKNLIAFFRGQNTLFKRKGD